jgi:hypothetical protein
MFAVAIALVIGFLIGRIISSMALTAEINVQSAKIAKVIPVVQIDRMEAGNIVGNIQGDVRVFIGENQVIPTEDTTFSVAGTSLLTNHISVLVPTGMRYVASKNGSKVYHVQSSQGSKLTPKNRVYFKTLKQALDAGYRQ